MRPETDSLGFRAWPGGPVWPVAPGPGAVHVWRVRLAPLRPLAARWRGVVRAEENERADRFHFDRDRETWLITRGVLRTLLGSYLGVAAADVELTTNASGKPELNGQFAARDLRFNVSHSGQCSLLAFAQGVDVGVDIEFHKPHCEIEELTSSVLSTNELEVFRRVPAELAAGAFFAAWTRKEAVLKALGVGLSVPPDLVEVAFGPGEQPALRGGPDCLAPFDGWWLRALDVAEDYSAALAVRAPEAQLTLWDYAEPGAE